MTMEETEEMFEENEKSKTFYRKTTKMIKWRDIEISPFHS